jgi:O-methyltransferase
MTRVLKKSNTYRFLVEKYYRYFKRFNVQNKPIETEEKKLSYLYEKYKKYTMIPPQIFNENISLVSEFKNLKGDFVECGVWKGGMAAAIAEFIGGDREFYLYDSFEGLPDVKPVDGVAAKKWQEDKTSDWYFDNCSADIHFAKEAMRLANVSNVHITKGWFENTLPLHPNRPIAILRLDGDWYDSTMQCLDSLYPKLIEGGVIIIDDYYTWEGCSKAVHDYLSKIKSSSQIRSFTGDVCYIVKKDISV